METTATSPMEGRVSSANKPRFSGFSHGSLPCCDLALSKRFFTEVLGGELFHDTPGFAEVRIAGAVIGLSEQTAGWTGWDAEYPHYAFFIEGKAFVVNQQIDAKSFQSVVAFAQRATGQPLI